MKTCAVIQARMGSTRLPGKVMLPLAGKHVVEWAVQRTDAAGRIDEVIVATSETVADDILALYADRSGATVFRGSEADVLGRMFEAADRSTADVVVRITGDCPLVSPEVVDEVVAILFDRGADYCSNTLDRTFPRGLDVEAFTFESFERIHGDATGARQREHVTPFYYEHPEEFDLVNVSSDAVFEETWMHARADLRLTLDEAADYELLRAIYENVPFDDLLDVRDAVRYVDENDLASINEDVAQKSA